jgi:hypothetical protein
MYSSAPHRVAVALAAVAFLTACRDAVSPRPSAATGTLAVRPDAPPFAAASRDIPPSGKGIDVYDDPAPPPRTRYRVDNHSGSIMVGAADVYLTWYGGWSTDGSAPDPEQIIIPDLVSNIGLSPYFSIVTARRITS